PICGKECTLRQALADLFNNNLDCADLLGGTDSALNMLNNMDIVNVPSPATFPSRGDQTAYNMVRANPGSYWAVTSWVPVPGTSSALGGAWNGQMYHTYVDPQFWSLGTSGQETVMMHEMGHPYTGYGNDAMHGSGIYNMSTQIPWNCGTAPLTDFADAPT